MRYALSRETITEAERRAVESGVVTVDSLMERAGAALAEAVMLRAPKGLVVVVCGKGNNGGDGWVAARLLHECGRDVHVLSVIGPDELRGASAQAATRAQATGVPWSIVPDGRNALDEAACVLDALFGIGFTGQVTAEYRELIEAVNVAPACVVAADVPSGVDADTGAIGGVAVRADLTVTFSALKPGLVQYPGADCVGRVVVADVGLVVGTRDDVRPLELWEPRDVREVLLIPPRAAHKGDRGRVLLIAGSRLYAGSAVLAAAGAMRMGAGYVFAAVPSSVVPVIQAALPHVIAVGLEETAEGTVATTSLDHIARVAGQVDAVVVGPGLTTHEQASEVARALVTMLQVPLVVDADALNAFAGRGTAEVAGRSAPTVITPHPGELARMTGSSVGALQRDRVSAARSVAAAGLTCILKGARTVVASQDRTALLLAGNPGMATAGSGDVLAGMVGTLLAQGLHPFDAAVAGAFIHARAGDLAAQGLSEVCLTAKDLPAYVPVAVAEILGRATRLGQQAFR